jgi:hypothetical protein
MEGEPFISAPAPFGCYRYSRSRLRENRWTAARLVFRRALAEEHQLYAKRHYDGCYADQRRE